MSSLLSDRLALNLRGLSANMYPGRGIAMGFNDTGSHFVQVYFITGRSPNSRNRILENADGGVRTAFADQSKAGNPELVIYDAMRDDGWAHVVSNGRQTSAVYERVEKTVEQCLPLAELLGLDRFSYEPDNPNFTPRITGLYRRFPDRSHLVEFVVIRRMRGSIFPEFLSFSHGCDGPLGIEGVGRLVTTYTGDGDPLPSFTGEPLVVPLVGDIEEIAREYWRALNPEHRVALAVKFIPTGGGEASVRIINRHSRT